MSFDFSFGRYFSGISQGDIDQAYLEVSTKYAGIATMWSRTAEAIRTNKRTLCYNYLVAWYLCDMYPSKVIGIDFDSRPLTSKNIGGVSLSYAAIEGQPGLQGLTTNGFGLKAKQMIETSPEVMGIYG
jgi:hypothetical protein